jgi:hypothetical protein
MPVLQSPMQHTLIFPLVFFSCAQKKNKKAAKNNRKMPCPPSISDDYEMVDRAVMYDAVRTTGTAVATTLHLLDAAVRASVTVARNLDTVVIVYYTLRIGGWVP